MALSLFEKEKLDEKILEGKLINLSARKEALLRKIAHVQRKKSLAEPDIFKPSKLENITAVLQVQNQKLRMVDKEIDLVKNQLKELQQKKRPMEIMERAA